MEQRIAAHGFFLLAGLAVACAAWGLLAGWHRLLDTLSHPGQGDFWFLILPGPAAALAAFAVHQPYLRALAAGRSWRLYGWALLGVLAAHLAYVLLMLPAPLVGILWHDWATPTLQGSPERPDLLMLLHRGLEVSAIAGVFSLILGLIPNLLIAAGFTEFLLRRDTAASSPPTSAS